MNKIDCKIGLERKEEYREVENLVRESFRNVYRPGCLEHYVLNQLRDDDAFIPELDFVMEKNGKINPYSDIEKQATNRYNIKPYTMQSRH